MSGVPTEMPAFRGQKLLLVGTGALGVAFMPFWLNWMRLECPDTELAIVLTPTASQFVSQCALSAISGTPVSLDRWPQEPTTTAKHVELARWADSVAVFPATFDFISRLASGRGDSPTMLAIQSTRAPVVIAPSLPPGIEQSEIYSRHLAALAERTNIAVALPHPGRSATSGEPDAAVSAPFPEVLRLLDELRENIDRNND